MLYAPELVEFATFALFDDAPTAFYREYTQDYYEYFEEEP